MEQKKKIIGITGGVGAGKSTVLDFLKEKYHAYVIQADLVGHLVTACSSLQVATTLNNEKITTAENATSLAHINGEIWGIYLFSIPLFTGSSTQPGRCAIFTDTVQVDNAVSMVTKKALNDFEATTVTDLTSERSSTWLLPFLVIWYNSVQVSVNAIR